MPFAAARSRHPLPTHAAGEVIGSILEEVGERPDLLVLIASPAFGGALEDLEGAARQILHPTVAVAMAAQSVLTGGEDGADTAAITLFAASWSDREDPADEIEVIHFGAQHAADPARITSELVERDGTLLLLVAEDDERAEELVGIVQAWNPELVIVGATAPSGAVSPGLVIDGQPIADGSVGVWLPPGMPLRVVSSQGTRPIGDPVVVTASRRGFVDELAGRPALEAVLGIADHASDEDRRALARGVSLGIVMNESADEPRSGDVRVLPVPGADRRTGAIAVDGLVPTGTTVQIRARDLRSIEEDLIAGLVGVEAQAALVFRDDRSLGAAGVGARTGAIVENHVDGRAVSGAGVAGVIGPVAEVSWMLSGGTAVLLFGA